MTTDEVETLDGWLAQLENPEAREGARALLAEVAERHRLHVESLERQVAGLVKDRDGLAREVRRLSIREGELLASRAEALGRAGQAERERDAAILQLREERGNHERQVATLTSARDLAEADNAALVEAIPRALKLVDVWMGTNEAREIEAILRITGAPHPGAALLERLRALEENEALLARVHPQAVKMLAEHPGHTFNWKARCITCAPTSREKRRLRRADALRGGG